MIIAPIPFLEASHPTIKSLEKYGVARIRVVLIASFNLSNFPLEVFF